VILAASVPIGLFVGALLGGRIDSLAGLRLRWPWLAVAGLAVQAVLFTEAGARLAGPAGPTLYVASTALVLVAVLGNIRLTGMPIVALGSLSNLAAIVANGGSMPTTAAALAAAGLEGPGAHTNSAILESPALAPLTDVYAIPAGLPLANVFSVGDVLIALGVLVLVVAAMRRPATAEMAGPAAAEPSGAGRQLPLSS
jgi:uncharacterized protein DUF5317